MTENTTPSTSKGTIVLVHGLWMTPKSWNGWKTRFEQAGYTVVVPAWPGVSDDIIGLRRDSSALDGLRISTVVDHLATVVDGIVAETGEQPIIMGHSFGGLMTQLLLDRGYGRAGIAIDSAQSAGVPVLPPSVVKAGMPVLGKPWTVNKTVLLSAKQFHYAFTNSLSMEESEKVREELQIPAPGKPLWQAALHLAMNTGDSKIDYKKTDRAPLLFVAGTADHIVPPKVNHKNAKAYKAGVVEVKEFEGRTHYIVGQDGWEEVADYSLAWAESH
ncbi:alpha/beta hydrolase [Aeromicrobium stalagmiti]|uniref:alpha/beta hydrolase n=1 Tax=Aeromicrobium stalagmiti TaxID=2738988 RepID=UPI001568BB20|nr:alpha/beta fold hydrolase [Aeromicrobium stalagmiti]NRQ51716.1 alpha/beta hydrolase [Aeromicrobium stalagmiti]